MMLSLHRVSIASLIACAVLATSTTQGALSPAPPVSVLPLVPVMTTDFVRVTAPWIAIPIDCAPMACEVGKPVMLIQENDEFFITMCSNAYQGVFLSAFPVSTREGRPAWTTPEQKVFFAYRTLSCRGKLYFKRGDELPVDGETRSEYKLRLERYEHSFSLYLSKTNSGVEFEKAPPPSPAQIAQARMVQKTAPASAQKTSAAPPQRTSTVSTPRLPPVKRYIVTPVGPSTNVFTIAMLEQNPSTVTPGKDESNAGNGFFTRLFSRSDNVDTAAEKPKEPGVAKSEPVQKATPTAAGAATSTAIAAASLSTNAQTTTAAAGPQAKTTSATARFVKYQTPIIIVAALVLFVVGLFWERQRKARKREIEMEAAAKALADAADVSNKPPPIASSSNDFSGSIASMSLGSVTQFLNSDKETGTLHVKDKTNAELGTLVFIKGEIIDAKSPNRRGIDALYEVLRNKEGFFSFLREEPKGVEKTITQGTISLLLDAHRIMDEEHMPPVPAPPPVPTSPAAKASHPAPKTATRLKLHGNR
jgi:hypothetical protein